MVPILVIVIIATALIFDFLNGFHDAANAIATVVVTKTLTPLQAVSLAAMANFVGFFFFGVAIANTVGKGIINPSYVTLPLILAALLGAVIWNIITWLLGLPTSSSHALIGGLIGAGIASSGFKSLIYSGILKIVLFIIIAPLIGMLGAIIFTIVILWIFHKVNRKKADKSFKLLQLLSATVYSIGHGTNDSQKTMGVIALTLFSAGLISTFHVDTWIVISCYAAISLGTFFGGWRIVKTMGTNITKIRSLEGFCAETSAATVLLGTARMGIPVSTTHVISGAIMGVGTVENARAVRWITAKKILLAWIMTIPITAIISMLSFFIIKLFV